MDLDLPRTFLAVVDAGSFVGAAERLHVTQAAVSRRIRALEETLGASLFTRSKRGAVPTPAGRKFTRHAATMLRTFSQARHELGSPGRYRAVLSVGARLGLWDQLMVAWLGRLRARSPDVCVRADIGFEAGLMPRLVDGSLDIGVMYTPQSRPGLEVEALLDEDLVLVSSSPDGVGVDGAGYVYVDWGAEFHARHMLAFPEYGGAGVVAGVGSVGLQQVLGHGGSGYFPRRLVAGHLASGRLTAVPGAPAFVVPAFVVYPSGTDTGEVGPAVSLLREVAQEIGRV